MTIRFSSPFNEVFYLLSVRTQSLWNRVPGFPSVPETLEVTIKFIVVPEKAPAAILTFFSVTNFQTVSGFQYFFLIRMLQSDTQEHIVTTSVDWDTAIIQILSASKNVIEEGHGESPKDIEKAAECQVVP
jgi:hypothetical protein